MAKNIVVLMGGLSAEREPSLMSGKNYCSALDKLGVKYTIIDPSYDLAEKLLQLKPDLVFNSLHGTYGEDGAIPGLLETMKIPYTHSGVLSSAIGMHKDYTKRILKDSGIRMAESFVVDISDVFKSLETGKDIMKRPYVIKPLQQGSTVGVHFVRVDTKELPFKLEDWKYGKKVLVERYIGGVELSTAVLGGKAIGSLELVPASGDVMGYKEKYTAGASTHIYPARIPKEAYDESMKFAAIAHNELGCRTISRSDFKFDNSPDGDNKLYFFEINTHPGMTPTSIVPDILKHNNIPFEKFVAQLIDEAKLDINP